MGTEEVRRSVKRPSASLSCSTHWKLLYFSGETPNYLSKHTPFSHTLLQSYWFPVPLQPPPILFLNIFTLSNLDAHQELHERAFRKQTCTLLSQLFHETGWGWQLGMAFGKTLLWTQPKLSTSRSCSHPHNVFNSHPICLKVH